MTSAFFNPFPVMYRNQPILFLSSAFWDPSPPPSADVLCTMPPTARDSSSADARHAYQHYQHDMRMSYKYCIVTNRANEWKLDNVLQK